MSKTYTLRSTVQRSTAALVACAVIAALVVLIPATPASALTPAPTATLDVPANTMIGEEITFDVTFTNAATTAVGFGPYIDLFLDSTGADGDDGITFSSATYLTLPVSSSTQTLACDGTDTHPLTGEQITCPPGYVAGDTLTVLTLPFGSFTPDQPDADIVVTADISTLADADEPLGIATAAGFRYGTNPLDDPTVDPPIVQNPPVTATVDPTVLRLTKTDNAPESETATGENFLRRWTVTAELAPGQTITDVTLADRLADTVAFDTMHSVSAGGTATVVPAAGTPQSPPDNRIEAEWPSSTGDVSMAFNFWIPADDANTDAVLDPDTGAPRNIGNDASVTATWEPIDPRDPPTVITVDPAGPEDTVTAKSLATQKSVEIVDDTGAPGPTPGDTLEWTIRTQISDYFSFAELSLDDTASDGQSIDATFTPTLAVTTPTFSGNIATFADHLSVSTQGCGSAEPGAIDIDADLSAALADADPASAGRYIGGEGSGATTAVIRLRTVIDSDYRCSPGAPAVNSNDVLTNAVTVTGAVLDGTEPTGSTVADSSSARVTIVAPALTKSIYAINGDTAATGPQISAGDVVTYRLRAQLPLTNTVDTSLTDFLPLPTFDIPGGGLSTDFSAPIAPGPFTPTPWSIQRGPTDTFTGTGGITGADPATSVDQLNNAFTLEYPDYQVAPGDTSATIDLLVNVVASNERFADGLFLTNQVGLTYSDSYFVASTDASIVQIELTEPRLALTKGVVATDRTSGATFNPAAVGPAGVTWSAPGSAGTRFSGGDLTSTTLAANPVNSNVSGLDAGDTATFAIVVENTGSGLRGAFDVAVADILPAGFIEPTGGWNVSVTDGNGDALAYSITAGAGPLGAGLTLTDPSATQGSLTVADPDSGTNVAVITFDATLDNDVAWSDTYTNTAEVTNYSASAGGPDFVTTPITDTADVNTANPDSSKVIISSQLVPGTVDTPTTTNLTIGSLVTYRVTLTAPEGTATDVELRDTLDAGLAVVSVDNIAASSALSTSLPGGFAEALADATVTSQGTGATAPGRRVTLDLGDLTNTNTDNTTAETVTVELTAVVLNATTNTFSASGRRNTSAVLVENTQVGPNRQSPQILVNEARIATTKTANVTVADAGDTVTYTLTLAAAASPRASTAYDVAMADPLPDGVTYVPGSFTHTAGVAPAALDDTGGNLTASWASIAAGATSTFSYQVTVDANASSFGPTVTNTASTTWSSQPGTPASASPYNTLGVERTGSTADVGGAANTYRSSDPAAFAVNVAGVTKALTGTSEAHTSGSTVTVGETVSYDITVALPEGELGEVVVTDLLPAGLAYVPGSVSVDDSALDGTLGTVSTTTAGNNVVVTFSNVTVSSTPATTDNVVVVSLDAIVADTPGNTNGTVLENRGRATVAGSQFTSPPVPVTVAVPTIGITKAVTPGTGAVSDPVNYTMTVTNTGNSAAFDVTVVDVVDTSAVNLGAITTPTGWTVTQTPVPGGIELRWTADAGTSIAAGGNAAFGFAATVADTITYPGSYTNTAEGTGDSMPGSPATQRVTSDDDDATLTFTAPDISVTKTADVTVAEAGEQITYTIEVTNDGDRDATGVSVVDTLGEHVSFDSATGGGVHDNGEITWPAFNLAVGDTVGFTVVVTVDDPLPVGATLTTNTVEAGDDGTHGPDPTPANNTDTVGVTLGAAPDIAVTKTDGQTVAAPGDTLTYTIDVTNVGNRDAAGVTLDDVIGDHLEFVAASDGGSYDAGTRTVTWAPFGLAGGGGTRQFTVTVTVTDAVPAGTTEVTNTATGAHPDDPNPLNDSSTDVTALDAAPDLAITKTDGSDTMLAGADVTYTIEVTNIGDRGASGVTVVDELPAAVEFSAASAGGTYDAGTHTVTWNLGTVEVGDVVTLTVDVAAQDPLPDGTTEVTNTVTVDDDGTNGEDPDPSDNTATDTDIAGVDLTVTKTLDGDTLTPGTRATYTITVTNAGPETVTEAVIDDTYPAGLTNPSFEPDSGTVDTDTLLWSGLTLAPGDTVTLRVSFDVELTAVGELTNTVTVTAVGPAERNPDDNTSAATDPVVPVVDLALTKTLQGTLERGEVATYILEVTNRGPSNATDVTIVDELPGELTYEAYSGDGWTCAATGDREVTCTLEGTLAPGSSAALQLDARVAADATGEIVNVARAGAAETNTGGAASVASAGAELGPLPEPLTPPAPAPTPTPAPTGAGELARTGSDLWLWTLLGVALLAAGVTLTRRRRDT